MTRTKCRKTAAFNTACGKVLTPTLKFICYHKAREKVTSSIVRDALVRLGYDRKEASSLAGSIGGSARQRFDSITNQTMV